MSSIRSGEFDVFLRRHAGESKYAKLRQAFRSEFPTEAGIEAAFAATPSRARAVPFAVFFRREYRSSYPPSFVERCGALAKVTFEETWELYSRLAHSGGPFEEMPLLQNLTLLLASTDEDDLGASRALIAHKNNRIAEVGIRAAAMANAVSDEVRLECFKSAPNKLCFLRYMLYDRDPGLRERVRQIRLLAEDSEAREILKEFIDGVSISAEGEIVHPASHSYIPPPHRCFIEGDWSSVSALLDLGTLDFLHERVFELLSQSTNLLEELLRNWSFVELREQVEALFSTMGRRSMKSVLVAFPKYPEACRALFMARESSERIQLLTEHLRDANEASPAYDSLIVETGDAALEAAYSIAERAASRDDAKFSTLRDRARNVAARFGASLRPIAVRRLEIQSASAFAAALLIELPATQADDPRLAELPLGPGVLVLSGRFDTLLGFDPERLAAALSHYPALERDDFWFQVIETAWRVPELTGIAKRALELFVAARAGALETEHVAGKPEFLDHLAAAKSPGCFDYVLRVVDRTPGAVEAISPAVARAPESFSAAFTALVESGSPISDGVAGVTARLPNEILAVLLAQISVLFSDEVLIRVLNRLAGAAKAPLPVCELGLARIARNENIEQRVLLSKAISRQCSESTARASLDAVSEAVEFGDVRIAENLLRMIERLKIRDESIAQASASRLGRSETMNAGLRKLLSDTVARGSC